KDRSPWEARALLLGICLLYLLWVSVIVPGPAAMSISGERDRRTWEALRLTSLRPSQIVAGKLLARLWPAALALVALLPLLLMGAYTALLSVSRLMLILIVLLVSPVPMAAMALWLSIRFRRTRTAVVLAYVVTGLVFWGALTGWPLFSLRGENLWWSLSPAWQAAILCLAEPGRGPMARPLLPEWAWFLLGSAALTGSALTLLTRRAAMAGE